jgi:hypothetical protein
VETTKARVKNPKRRPQRINSGEPTEIFGNFVEPGRVCKECENIGVHL